MSEPDSGSDLAAVRTRAVRRGDGWVINGSKIWTSNAHRVHYLIALARTGDAGEDRHGGLTQFIIDLAQPGVTVRPIHNLAGGHEFNEVFFQDYFVPHDMMVGSEGQGWSMVTAELAFERSGPDRFLSDYRLLVELIDRVGPEANQPAGGGDWPPRRPSRRAAAHVGFGRRSARSRDEPEYRSSAGERRRHGLRTRAAGNGASPGSGRSEPRRPGRCVSRRRSRTSCCTRLRIRCVAARAKSCAASSPADSDCVEQDGRMTTTRSAPHPGCGGLVGDRARAGRPSVPGRSHQAAHGAMRTAAPGRRRSGKLSSRPGCRWRWCRRRKAAPDCPWPTRCA